MFLPWNQDTAYWIVLIPEREFTSEAQAVLKSAGLDSHENGYWMARFSHPWVEDWRRISTRVAGFSPAPHVAVVAGDAQPSREEIENAKKPYASMEAIASSLWLGDALLGDRVLCYLQPVMSSAEKPVGYEAFARVKGTDGKIIGGGEIVNAARALGIEYALDKQLHIEAIKTFVAGNVSGFLFINFFPGFIQRAEVYLEGLSETARSFGIISKNIVLDFTQAELPRDMGHVKKVMEFCRAHGYALALDDVESAAFLQKILADARPDFVKLDRALVQRSKRGSDIDNIRTIVQLCRGVGALTVAEGVENQEVFETLKSAGVDLFQGYHFAPPQPVEQLPEMRKNAG